MDAPEGDAVDLVALAVEDLEEFGVAVGKGRLLLGGQTVLVRVEEALELLELELRMRHALADDLLTSAGYGWFEISNWAKPGRESRHNLVYWNSEPWAAVGPGAHAFDGDLTRSWNAARLDAYRSALGRGSLPPGGDETVDRATAESERAILKLRTAAGLPATQAAKTEFSAAIAWGRANGLLEASADGTLTLTRDGRLLSNEVFLRFLPAAARHAA